MGARIFLGLFGLLSIPYGIYCFLRPGFLEAFAGVAATSTTGTVELRPHLTWYDKRCGLAAKSCSTSPQTKVRSSSTFEPCASCTSGLPGA